MNFQTALLDVRQMGEADRLTVASGKTVIELMENAGSAVAREIEKRWSVRPVIVLCGPGNNGGDGFVTARHLSELGWPVDIALLGSRDKLTDAARHHAELWRGTVSHSHLQRWRERNWWWMQSSARVLAARLRDQPWKL